MMDCGWESSDDDHQMEIDLESRQDRQEEQRESTTLTTEDVSPASKSGEDCDPPAEDYDPADPTSDVEDSHDNPTQENESVSPRPMEASGYDPADPTLSDNEESTSPVKKDDSDDENRENSGQAEDEVKEDDIQKADSTHEDDACLKGDSSVDICSQEEDNDGRWDSQLEASFSQEQLEKEEEEELGMSPNKAEEEAEIITSPSKDEAEEAEMSPGKVEEEAGISPGKAEEEEEAGMSPGKAEEEEEAGMSPGKAEEEDEVGMSPGKAEEEDEVGMSPGKAEEEAVGMSPGKAEEEEEVGMSPGKAEEEEAAMSPGKAEEEEEVGMSHSKAEEEQVGMSPSQAEEEDEGAGRSPNEAVEKKETEASNSKVEETNARMFPSKAEEDVDVGTSPSKAEEEAENKSEFSSIIPENGQEIVTFEDHQSSRDETFGRNHMPTTPPFDTDDNTQASNISLINNADEGTSDVPEVTFDDSDFVLEKEPFEPSIEEKEVQNYQGQSQESSGWKSVDSQGEEETSWRKTHGNNMNEGESDTFRRGEEIANCDEEALVDLFREESEPDKDNVVDGETEQPLKRTKKKLGSKKVKKKGKKLKKGQGKKGLTKLHDSTHGDQRFVEISRERPSVESKEDGELDTEALGYSRKRSHEERLSLGVYDQAVDIEFAHLEEEEQREPGEIVESEGKKKGSKKKEKKERKKKKTRREVATIEDGGQGDDDSQKFPSFLAGFFVQDEGEEDLDEGHDNFVNVFDEDEARGFHKSSTEKNYRKRQDSGHEGSVRSYDHNVIENQDRRVEEVEHRRSRKHEERRHESRERQHSSRDIREVRYEREHRHELLREKEREREKERSRSERTRERGRDKERERERERDRERERERLRRSEGEERRRRGSRSRSMERHRRSRSYERNRRSRSRDRSSRQRRRRSRSYDRSLERDRERERERERERSKRRRKERSREREIQRRVRRASHSRSRSPRRRAERASSNKENRNESHRRRRQRYQEESGSEERESNRRSQRRQRHERERSSSSSSSSSQSSSNHPTPFQNALLNHSFQSRHSFEDEGASSDVILVEPERIVINLDEEEDPPSRVDITHANARDDSATLVDGQSIPPPPEMSGSARASALIEINPAEHEDNAEEETGDATPTRDEASDIARSKYKTPPAVQESDYDPAHPTEEDGDQELVTNATKNTARPPIEKGPVPPDHPPPEEVRPSPPPVPAESVLEPPQPRPPMPNNALSNPVMRLINPLLLQQQQQSNHQQPGLLPFPNMPGQPPRFMNWPVNQNNSGQPPSAFGQGQRHMRPLLPTPDGRGAGFRPDSSGAMPPFPTNSLPPMNLQQTGPGPHPQMPISSMPPLAQLTSLLPALEKAKLAAQDSSQPLMFKPGGSGNSLLKPPLSASLSSNMSSMRMSSYRGRPDLSESTEVVDMDMSPGDEDCELELPSPNSDSSESREGRRRRGRRGDSHHSKNDKSAPSSNKGIIQPVVYLKALSKAIEKLTPRGSAPGGTASSHDRSKQVSRKRRVDLNDDDVPASAVDLTNKEKYMRKLHLQERVIDEVKLAIKPFYSSKKINKDQYKLILRKAVPKVCHSKSGNINPQKIQQLVEAYVGKLIKGKTIPKKKRAHPPTKEGAGRDNKDAAAPVRQNGERPKKVSR